MRMLADANPALDLSLIIATRNRHDSLVRMLRAYRQIRTSVRWEMIIVDNGSIDGTAALLASEARRGRLPLLVIREEKPGLSRARNAGLRRAAGRLICFTDDDCYPDTAFLDAWMQVFATLPLDYAGGRVELFDPTDAATTIRTDLAPKPLLAGRFIAPGEVHGANLAFRREVVLALGPFLEAFGAGTSLYSAEDFEYCLRASARGFTGSVPSRAGCVASSRSQVRRRSADPILLRCRARRAVCPSDLAQSWIPVQCSARRMARARITKGLSQNAILDPTPPLVPDDARAAAGRARLLRRTAGRILP